MSNFGNSILFMMAFLLIGSCGQKSTIKNDVAVEKLACAYGDCKHIIQNVTFALDDSSMAFKTPLPGLGPIAGGLIKFVGDIFAKNTKKGRYEFSYVQPLPELPEILNSVKVKRLFFYMKPKKASGLDVKTAGVVETWIRRYLLGEGKTTFDFVGKFGMKLSAEKIKTPESYDPIFTEGLGDESSELLDIFKTPRTRVVDTEVAKELVLVRYQNKTKEEDTSNEKYGRIHYLETTRDPIVLKEFFRTLPEFQGQFKRILLLSDGIILELKKDPVANEVFKVVMEKHADELDRDLGVNFVDTCTVRSCLELSLPDVNLMPIAKKGNALKLDALLQANIVPESFKLKGYVEFEVKLESDI